MTLRIGFDISQTGDLKAGCGFVADSLIRELAQIDHANAYTLYPAFGDAYSDPTLDATTIHLDRPHWRRGPTQKTTELARDFWNTPPSDFEDRLGNPDLIHSNNFYCPMPLHHARLIYTLYDLAFVDYPDLATERNRTHVFTGVFNASLTADYIVSISRFSRDHFLRIFPHYPAERIVVIHPGSRFTPSPTPLTRPASLDAFEPNHFWLGVGTIEPRKNQRRLVEAYARLKAAMGQTHPLILAGAKGWLMDDFDKLIEDLGLQKDVIKLGYVDDAELHWLYQNCFALCYPSLFEGFGLPVLEAMTLGAPVIASNSSSLPEIVGDSSPLVDPLDVEDIAGAMIAMQRDPDRRAVLRERSLAQAAKFNWPSAARRVFELYGLAAAEPKVFANIASPSTEGWATRRGLSPTSVVESVVEESAEESIVQEKS